MKEQIIDIIYELTENDLIKEQPDIDLLENILDSIDFINLVTELQNVFNIEIELSQIPSQTWRSVDKIVEMIKNYLGE